MNESTPWKIALSAAVTAGALSTSQASDKASEVWADPDQGPALLNKAQMTHVWDLGQEGFKRGSNPATEQDVQAQARVSCIADALQGGLPPELRGEWNIEVRSGAGARTATPGGQYIAITPKDASHPGGVHAVAFILAHEMAHNVGRHGNRVLTDALTQEEGVERTKETLKGLGNEGLEEVLVDAMRGRDAGKAAKQSIQHEYEADRGALDILDKAGVPLKGARAWAKEHKREIGAYEWDRATHPAPDARERAIDREARKIERGGGVERDGNNDRADPTRQCKDSKLERKGWMKKAWDHVRGANGDEARIDEKHDAAPLEKTTDAKRMTGNDGKAREAMLKELESVRERARQTREEMTRTTSARTANPARQFTKRTGMSATGDAAASFTPPKPRTQRVSPQTSQLQAAQTRAGEGIER